MSKSARFQALIAFAAVTASAAQATTGPTAPRAVSPTSPREAAFGRQLDGFITQLRASPHAVPGTVVVAVHGGKTVFEKAYGVRDLATGAPMTLDTPVYNASVTKAYTGLLAAMLDAEGTLPLDASLKDVWPTITLPAPLDPAAVKVRRLLSHTSGISAGGLNYRSVWTGQVQMADVPTHLARFATPQDPGFSYDNLGPFIWSAMAFTRTGVHWRDLLRQRILTPLGLSRTSARLEDFPLNEVARCHPRVGGAWHSIPPKPTAVLNAAGGMFASGRDEATFLKAFITDGKSVNGRIPATILRRTWQKESDQKRTMWDRLHRDGYGLGWDLGTVSGERFVARSGGYTGCRATSMFFPEHKLGIVVTSNGDAAANSYNATILAHAIEAWVKPAKARAETPALVAATHKIMADAVRASDTIDARLAKAKPVDPRVRAAAIGRYRNERLGDLDIGEQAGELVVTAGVLSAPLRYLGGDSFLLLGAAASEVETFSLIRDRQGRVVAFLWEDDRYERTPDRGGQRGA